MFENSKQADVWKEAKEIVKKGWVKGYLKDSVEGGYCIMGAYYEATARMYCIDDMWTPMFSDESKHTVKRKNLVGPMKCSIQKAFDKYAKMKDLHSFSASDFNDDPDTSKEDVLEFFDFAIEEAVKGKI